MKITTKLLVSVGCPNKHMDDYVYRTVVTTILILKLHLQCVAPVRPQDEIAAESMGNATKHKLALALGAATVWKIGGMLSAAPLER